MKRQILFFFAMTLLSGFSHAQIIYPKTAKEDVVNTYFGTTVADPYRWLENDTSKATSEWVKQQNKVTNDYLAEIPFRKALKKRLTELYNYPKYATPFKKNGYYYYYKNNGLQNQSVLYRQKGVNGTPELVLDPNIFSADGTVALSHVALSKDGKYLAYSIARSGSDWNEIFVMNATTKELLPDHILWSKSSEISWHGSGFYYSAYDAPEKGKEYSVKNEFEKVFYHEVGQPQSQDKLIYEDREHPLRECYASVTSDEKYLIITITETTTGNALIFKDLTKVNDQLKPLAPGFENDYTVLEHFKNKLYVLTNWKASRSRLMEVDPDKPSSENWKELIPETENVLEHVSLIGGKLVATYMKDAAHHVYVFDLNAKKLDEVKLPSIGSIVGNGFDGDMDDTEGFYNFTSYTLPPTIYRFDVVKNESEVFLKSNTTFNPDDYVSEQIFYKSKDGTRVPMTIISKKGIRKDGQNPVMIYGYGGFNISLNPSFSVARILFLEQGGIYCIANLRGGGEYGEEWHMAGTKLHKQNVFDDFISAAEYLIKKGYTNPSRLAIDGGSNGGLLVGACMTQRPDLYAVAVPEVGVLDMLRYHLFTIGWSWASDYGTSEESAAMFNYLRGYSPLHNLKLGVKYPATFVMTGDHDDRVVPAHSFKFAATLQEVNAGNNPTLIRIDSKAGHGAGKPIGKVIDAQSDMWSFVMWNLGIKPIF